jgi:hypothetical protein
MKKSIYKYYPFRFQIFSDNIMSLATERYYSYGQDDRDKLQGMLWHTILEALLKEEYPGQKDIWYDSSASFVMGQEDFIQKGANVFDIRPALVDMFKNTDVDSVRPFVIKFPFNDIYLYWSDAASIIIDGKLVDGAYISLDYLENDTILGLTVTMTTNSFTDPTEYASTGAFLIAEPHYSVMLMLDDEPEKETVSAMLNRDYLNDNASFKTVDVEERRHFLQWKQQIEDVLRLTFNALCFLGSKHNDAITAYSEGAPRSLVDKLSKAKTAKEIKRNQSKLESLGYRKVHFMGSTFSSHHSSQASGSQKSTHWRRGHWRNQALGPKRNQHKHIWIMPTLVNKEKDFQQVTPRVYDVDATGDSYK